MAINRLLSLSILALAALGCGAAGMLAAFREDALADMRTEQARLATVRSLAGGGSAARHIMPRADAPGGAAFRLQAVAFSL